MFYKTDSSTEIDFARMRTPLKLSISGTSHMSHPSICWMDLMDLMDGSYVS